MRVTKIEGTEIMNNVQLTDKISIIKIPNIPPSSLAAFHNVIASSITEKTTIICADKSSSAEGNFPILELLRCDFDKQTASYIATVKLYLCFDTEDGRGLYPNVEVLQKLFQTINPKYLPNISQPVTVGFIPGTFNAVPSTEESVWNQIGILESELGKKIRLLLNKSPRALIMNQQGLTVLEPLKIFAGDSSNYTVLGHRISDLVLPKKTQDFFIDTLIEAQEIIFQVDSLKFAHSTQNKG